MLTLREFQRPSAPPAEGSSRGLTAYLAGLSSPASRKTMRYALDRVARVLTGDEAMFADEIPWQELRFTHVSALRARLANHYAPASANTMLAAVRGVLRYAWQIGELDTDSYMRAVAVKSVPGSRLPAGRALKTRELRALFAVCASDRCPAGSRDAAAFALMFGAGLRRTEAVSVQLEDYDAETRELFVTGKGNRQRIVHAGNGAADALLVWLTVRGDFPGALLAPVNKGGVIEQRPMSAQALMYRVKLRSKQAGIAPCSPHDLRRTFVSELLDAGADIATVQKLAGHQSPTTTARYDRRGERAKKRAAEMLIVPYQNRGDQMIQDVFIARPTDVQKAADFLDIFDQKSARGLPGPELNRRLAYELQMEPSEYDRVMRLACADGLITTGAMRKHDGGNEEYLLFPVEITDAGRLYLEAWRGRVNRPAPWADAVSALHHRRMPKTPANMLGLLREQTHARPGAST